MVEHEVEEVATEPAAEPPDLVALLKQRLARGGAGAPAASKRRRSPDGRSKSELYALAQELGIEGRSRMSKDELASAIRAAS